MAIDTLNKFMVASKGDKVVIMKLGAQLTPDEALNLAAWLVAVSGRGDFQEVLDAVLNT